MRVRAGKGLVGLALFAGVFILGAVILAVTLAPRMPETSLAPPAPIPTPTRIAVPDVRGQPVEEAWQHLTATGLLVEVHGSGTVRFMQPRPGALVLVGTMVDVTATPGK